MNDVHWIPGAPPDTAGMAWLLVEDEPRKWRPTLATFVPADPLFDARAVWMEARDWRGENVGEVVEWRRIKAHMPFVVPEAA